MKMHKISNLSLELECWSDELSPAQLAVYERAENEYKRAKEKLRELTDSGDGEIDTDDILMAQFSDDNDVSNRDISPRKLNNKAKIETIIKQYKRKTPVQDDDDEDLPLAKRAAKNKEKEKLTGKAVQSKEKKLKNSEKDKIQSPGLRPSEITSIGGLTVGNVDIKQENNKNEPDSKEITFNKNQGKTFPSLVVVVRPSLKAKEPSNVDRNALDTQVKTVLMLTPEKFTEWLIQQGLLKSVQKCAIHAENELKLGVYSDGSKFPYSGGYVWISECCPTRFVSVFYGSIFEGAPHPPSCILKLIYHWCCQTNIQSVVQWVKIDNVYIKGIYTWLRAVCTLALHRHFGKLGGPGKYIEVGVISLGTTTQDGQQRQVKVEVLGVLDHEEKFIRLRAIEPYTEADKNYKKRFSMILEPLNSWVSKESTITIDLTIDKNTLTGMGFKNIIQTAAADTSAKHTNATVMDYLRRIVPRMFQNTLSLLSRQMIQQFLDELVWREQYGISPLQTFNNITTHIAEETRVQSNQTLVTRLFQVATNPYKDWSNVEAGNTLQKDTNVAGTTHKRGRKPCGYPIFEYALIYKKFL